MAGALLGVLLISFFPLPVAPAQEKKTAEEELKAENVSVPSTDGYNVFACIRKPEGDGPFPAIVVVHGGLGEAGRNALRSNLLGVGTPVMEEMYKAGYVVVMSDFRRHEFGGREIDDVAAVFAHVEGLPYVKKGAVGLYGASRGGYVALMAATRVKPAAVVVCAPPVVLEDVFRNIPAAPPPAGAKPSPRAEIGRELIEKLGGTTETAPDKYRALSVLTHAAKINSPVLIIQGAADPLADGAKLLKQEMDRLEKPCELALYPDQPHGFYWGLVRAGGVSAATREALARTIAFFGASVKK